MVPVHDGLPAPEVSLVTALRRHLGRHGQFRIARRLDDLRTWRNLYDYEDTVRNLSLILRSAVAAARDVVEALV